MQAEDQLNRFFDRDRFQIALIKRMVGQSEIIVRRPAHFTMRSPEISLGEVGGLAAIVHFFQIDKQIEVGSIGC